MSAIPATARLIIDPPASGPWNMAVDASILQLLEPGNPPTLRFYRWARPTLSLGYFQALGDRRLHPASESMEVVRRATGGGAIVHDRELTYSLAVSSATRQTGASARLYQTVHQCFIDTLGSLGIVTRKHGSDSSPTHSTEPFLCFQRRTMEDLVVGGYKILGSAQRRGQHGLLQHGSLLLSASPFAPELPGVMEMMGTLKTSIDKFQRGLDGPLTEAGDFMAPSSAWQELSDYLVHDVADRIAQQLNWTVQAGALTAAERNAAERLEVDRFSQSDWTAKR